MPSLSTSDLNITFIQILFRSGLLVGHERQQCQVPGAQDRLRELPLVPGAGAGDAAGQNLSPIGRERPQQLELLPVHVADLFGAETADFPARRERSAPLWGS